MLKLDRISVSFGQKSVLSELSFEARAGDRIHLRGPSGAGKTTLLSVIAGLLKPDDGTAIVSGEVAYMFQESRLLPWIRAEENVAFVLPKRSDPRLVRKYLEAVGLWEDRNKLPTELSGGMCRRVALARTLAYAEAVNAEILLLDEPFSGVDAEMKSRLYPILLQASENRVLILSTHDGEEAAALCEKTVNIEKAAP